LSFDDDVMIAHGKTSVDRTTETSAPITWGK